MPTTTIALKITEEIWCNWLNSEQANKCHEKTTVKHTVDCEYNKTLHLLNCHNRFQIQFMLYNQSVLTGKYVFFVLYQVKVIYSCYILQRNIAADASLCMTVDNCTATLQHWNIIRTNFQTCTEEQSILTSVFRIASHIKPMAVVRLIPDSTDIAFICNPTIIKTDRAVF